MKVFMPLHASITASFITTEYDEVRYWSQYQPSWQPSFYYIIKKDPNEIMKEILKEP